MKETLELFKEIQVVTISEVEAKEQGIEIKSLYYHSFELSKA